MVIADVKFKPFLIYNGNIEKDFKNGDKYIKYIIKNKLDRVKQIVRNSVLGKVIKYNFNVKDIEINVKLDIKRIKSEEDNLEKTLIDYFGNYNTGKYFGELGPDTWMEGNIGILQSGEVDNHDYELGLAFMNVTSVQAESKKIVKVIKKHSKKGSKKNK